jgi:hypothetical protein
MQKAKLQPALVNHLVMPVRIVNIALIAQKKAVVVEFVLNDQLQILCTEKMLCVVPRAYSYWECFYREM